MSHPFGDLLSQHLHRKHGLSQSKLAAGILQDPSIIAKMCKGERLTGPQARERVLTIIAWLREQAVLETVPEANALLATAGMSPLREDVPAEEAILQRLRAQPQPIRVPAVAPVRRTNLPAPLTSFVGRAHELAEITQLIAAQRLVTLTDAGGVDKTRLAIEVGIRLVQNVDAIVFADGVWMVELAALAQPTLVAQAIARLFKLPEQPGRATLDLLQDYLADKHLLLILENCEHLADTCAEIIQHLLQHCWQVHILATSREELRVPGEAIYPVLPLALPDPVEQPTEAELPVFVAQEHELAQLDHFLDLALAGRGRAVFVIGEAGSGKTALVQEFARRAQAKQPDLIAAGGNCNAYTGLGDPYLPFREILGRLTGDLGAAWTASQVDGRRLQAFTPHAIQALTNTGPDLIDTFVPGGALVSRAALVASGNMAWLAQLRDRVAHHEVGQGGTNVKQADLFEQYARVIQVLAGQHPLLLVLDDLQWADAGSINLLFHLGRRLQASRVLIVGLYRSTEIALGRSSTARQAEDEAGKGERERHPLESLVHEFQLRFGDILVDLGQAAGQHFVDAFLDSEPNRLGPAFREALYRHTGGHALFTVEMLRGMQERGDLVKDEQDYWMEGPALNWEILPARVEGVIAERMGRLPPMLREILKVASVEGELFTAEVVGRVQMIDERLMVRYLSGELDGQYRLIQNQSSRRLSPGGQPMSQYRFRHILFQKYLYNNLDDAECTYLHEAVGQVLERMYGGQTGDIAVQLARHYEAAGWSARAVDYLQQAGDRAVHLSANEEALAHFAKGLALLETLPATPERNRQELDLQIALFAPLAAVKGYAASELGQAYGRGRELCRLVDDAPRLFVVTYGLWGHNLVRMNLDLARELAQQCLAQAQASQDPARLLEGNRMMGETAIHRGELVPAREYFERSRALYDPERHHAHAWVYGQDPGVALLSHGAWTLWHLGYPDQALAWSHEARALAQAGSHPFSTAFAEEYASILHEMRGERQESLARAEAVITLAREQRFGEWLLLAESSRAWIRVETGDVNVGITQLRQGLDAHRATGSEMFAAYYLTLLARAYMCAGQADAARAALDEALAIVERTEGRLWEAEIYRLRGELLLSRDGSAGEAEAEACYLKGFAIARQRQARSLELRVAMSLSRLWQRQGKIAEARQRLTETYGWFTEGFETADLREARALLEALA